MGVVGLFAAVALVAVGCGSESHFGPPGQGGASSTGNGVFPAGTGGCSPEDSEMACHVTIGTHNGITNCLDGVQVCSEGQWTACSQGELSPSAHRGPIEQGAEAVFDPTVDDAQGASLPRALLTMLGPCNDKCDPTCQQITEGSPPGGMAMGMGVCPWVESPRSALTSAQGSLTAKGYNEPCGAAWDCEFDQYCSNPVTDNMPGSCAHDKCARGSGLGGCNDSCVQAVLADPFNFFCNFNWGNSCVQAVYAACGIDCVNTTIGCAHDKCITGKRLVDLCDNASPALSCVHQVCTTAGLHHCCQPGQAWDQACVNAIATACSASDACPSPQGVCQPWMPGMTDPDCAGSHLPDLTAGTVCNTPAPGSQDVIPICNVGDVTANPPITVNVYAGASGNAPGPPPGSAPQSVCMVTQPIPAGACVDVPCPGTNNNDEIFVNPPGGSQIPECNSLNNWGIRIGGAMPPTCANPGTCTPPATPVPPITYTGTCLPGTGVQWRWLTYDTTDPPGASVDFFVQTAGLPAPVKVVTATSANHVCALAMGGGCPVDLVGAIGNGPSFSDTITISATLNSAGAGPTINQWQVEYSCADNQ